MLIKRLKLQNFAQHKNLDKEIKGNLIGVLGKNGCGKTNFLNAIRFAFTGDADGTKESMISHGLAEADKKGSVEMWFSAHGKDGYIKRALHSQTRTFTYGEMTYKKDAEINVALRELFGMDKDMLRNLTFIRQGELQKLLFGDPAEREANFIKIFGLGHTEAIRATLLSKIEMLEHHVVDLVQLIDENKVSLQKQQEIVKDLEAQAGNVETVRQEWAMSRNLFDAVIDADKKFKEMDTVDLRISELEKTLGTFSSSVYVSDAEISKRRDRVIKLDSEITTGNETAKNVATRDQLRSNCEYMRNVLKEQAVKELGVSAPLQMLPDASDADELDKKIERTKGVLELSKMCSENKSSLERMDAEMKVLVEELQPTKARIAELAKKVNEDSDSKSRLMQTQFENKKVLEALLTKPDSCECPFCLSKIENVSAVVSTMQARIQETDMRVATVAQSHAQSSSEHDKLLARYQQMIVLEARIKKDAELTQLNCTSALRDITSLSEEPVFGSAEEVNQQILLLKDKRLRKTFEEALRATKEVTAREQNKLDGIEALLEKLTHVPETAPDVTASAAELHHLKQWLSDSDVAVQQMNSAKGSLQQSRDDRKRMVTSLGTCLRPKDSDIVTLRLNMDTAEKRWQTSQEIVGRLDQARQASNGFKLRLAELEGNVERGRKTADLVTEFKKVREVLERRNLPLTYIQQYFKRLLPMVQNNLGTVGADFIVRNHATDPVSFVFDRADGTCMNAPVDKLSGGQKVRLVVAFLFALHEVMSSRMGFLVLDEPTVFLDDTGVESFGELLSNIVIRLQSSDMQVLISTHEQSLKPNFSSCIQLGNVI